MTTILVIEDESALREEIIDTLTFEGFDTLGAPNGREGLDIAFDALPDLIICDIAMPEMDGYQVLTALRDNINTAKIPLIFLTAKANRSFMRYGMELGADDYLTKPFSHVELLAAIEARLARKEKMAEINSHELEQAMRKIAQMVTHELRTPLVSIAMVHDIISKQMDQLSRNQLEEFLESLRTGSQRLRHVVEQMVFVTQLESGSLSTHTVQQEGIVAELWSILTTAINLARSFAYRNTNMPIRLKEHDHQVTIQCHTEALKHALAELITNALNFSPEHAEVAISMWEADGMIWISILDSGPGMPPDELQQAMRDYQQIDRVMHEQQGIGLGLPLARKIIDVHNGSLEISSVVDKGTQVTVKLPVASS